jgi:hypothetical protein
MKKDTRNGLIFVALIAVIMTVIYKKSPVLQAEAKKQ